MISWTGQQDLFQSLASDVDTTNLAFAKTLLRQGQSKIEALLDLYFTEETRTFTTRTDAISGTSYQSYKLPENYSKFNSLYVTVGTTQYLATLIQDESIWRDINADTTGSTSDFLQFCFIRRDRVELYPIPSSANTATLTYDSRTKPLSVEDYVTGTVTTLANDSTALTASGSTFTSAMVGRYLRVDSDGEWYKIAAFGTTTTLTLDTKYQGISIAAGTEAFTIGQFPITPDEMHELPVWYALWKWSLFKKDTQLAREWERAWKEGIKEAEGVYNNKEVSGIVKSGRGLGYRHPINPNYYPQNMS